MTSEGAEDRNRIVSASAPGRSRRVVRKIGDGEQAVDWIADDVAIGNCLEARDSALLKQHGIRSALSLDGTLTEQDAMQLGMSEVVSYRLIDGPGNDLRVVRFAIDDLKRLAATHSPHSISEIRKWRQRQGGAEKP